MITHEIIKVKAPPSISYQGFQKQEKAIFVPELKVGDWVYYSYNGSPITIYSQNCSVVIAIETDPEKYKKNSNGIETPYLLMGLTGTSNYNRTNKTNVFHTDPWTRWTDGLNILVVKEDVKKELLDDFVQDYIQKHQPKALTYVR
jgi:hypothetical protein